MNFLFNVYTRLDELEVNLRCLRHIFPDSFVGVYHNGPTPRAKGQVVDHWIWGENTGHHNGTRDAYNAFVPYVRDDQYYACIHADVWCSDYRLYAELGRGMSGKAVGFLDPGPTGAMHNPQHMGYYADMFIMRGDAYRRMFPIEEELDGHEWIETTLYKRTWERFQPYEIWEIPNRCDRSHHRDAPFVFENPLSRQQYRLSGDDSVQRRIESLLVAGSEYADVFAEFMR